MKDSNFACEHFTVNYNGIEILKNRLAYKYFDYKEIDYIEIKKDRSVKNWLLITLIGSSISFLSLLIIIKKTPAFFTLVVNSYYNSSITYYSYIAICIVFLFGLFLVIISNLNR